MFLGCHHDIVTHSHLSTLKPLGLNILLNSDCAAQPARTKNVESHRRFNSFLLHGCVDPAQQSKQRKYRFEMTFMYILFQYLGCLCQLSGAIGFSDDIVSKFVSKKCIQTFAPYNITAEKTDHPNMFTQIVQERNTSKWRLKNN
jgi:hypothetical protein